MVHDGFNRIRTPQGRHGRRCGRAGREREGENGKTKMNGNQGGAARPAARNEESHHRTSPIAHCSFPVADSRGSPSNSSRFPAMQSTQSLPNNRLPFNRAAPTSKRSSEKTGHGVEESPQQRPLRPKDAMARAMPRSRPSGLTPVILPQCDGKYPRTVDSHDPPKTLAQNAFETSLKRSKRRGQSRKDWTNRCKPLPLCAAASLALG